MKTRRTQHQSNEQRLIDIMFQVALMVHENKTIQAMNQEEVAEWVAHQLRGCGFDTTPCGASWGVLKSIRPEFVQTQENPEFGTP